MSICEVIIILNKIYSSILCKGYRKEVKKIKKRINNILESRSDDTENNEFLNELLKSNSKHKKIAAAYFIIKKYTGKFLYDVQMMAILAMLDGCFVDVKTGEGKTIIIGAYCLIAEKPIHVITVNDYLAKEAVRQLGKMYEAFDISCDVITEDSFHEYDGMHKDVIYGTAASFAFKYIVHRYQRSVDYELNTAVIDEADYILIDNATSSFNVGVEETAGNDSIDKYRMPILFAEKIKDIFNRANIVYVNFDEVKEWNNLENHYTNTIFINKHLKFVDFSQDIQDYVMDISDQYNMGQSEALAFMYNIVIATHILEKDRDYIVRIVQSYMIFLVYTYIPPPNK